MENNAVFKTDYDNLQLLALAQSGDKKALDMFTLNNMGLVKMAAKRFCGRGVDFEDLVQIGSLGLIKAIKRFDITQDVRFSTYAVPLIIGELKRYFRDNNSIKISRSIKETGQKIRAVIEHLEKELGREPTLGEISESSGISVEEISQALDAMQPLVSLDDTLVEDKESNLHNMLGEDKSESLLESIAVKEALSRLNARERMIIIMRFFNNKTQSETAEKLGVSQVQVSRLERTIIDKIRALIE